MYEETKEDYIKKHRVVNLDKLVEKLEVLYESGDKDGILSYANALEKRMEQIKDDPRRAQTYLKGAIESYGYLEDFENIKRILIKGKSAGISMPVLKLNKESPESVVKVARLINEVYRVRKVIKRIKRRPTTNYSTA